MAPCAAEHLTVLELDNCPLITDASLEHLVSCHNLQRIELYDCQLITRAGIRRLRVREKTLSIKLFTLPLNQNLMHYSCIPFRIIYQTSVSTLTLLQWRLHLRWVALDNATVAVVWFFNLLFARYSRNSDRIFINLLTTYLKMMGSCTVLFLSLSPSLEKSKVETIYNTNIIHYGADAHPLWFFIKNFQLDIYYCNYCEISTI